MNISIVGLGYVGLPLALLAARKYSVTGIDIDQNKMDALSTGRSYIDDVQDEQLSSSTATFTSDFNKVSDSEIVIICVPTPVNETKQPDLTPVKGAVKAIAKHLQDG